MPSLQVICPFDKYSVSGASCSPGAEKVNSLRDLKIQQPTVTVVNRLAENHSDLAVLDARNVSAGPVALFRMPVRVRMAFHGTWVPAETFRTRSYAMEIACGDQGALS